jgi:signal peptidase
VIRVLRTAALWLGGGLALGLLLAAAVPQAIGGHAYTVRSGSMAPAIDTGDVVVTRTIEPLAARAGQIVTFFDPDGSERLITHRVRALHRVGDRVEFVTQGDANTGQEHWNVASDGEIGRVLYRIPKLGYALIWIQGPVGRIALVVLPTLALMVFALIWIWRTRTGEGRADAPAG